MNTKTLHRAAFITGNVLRQVLVSVFSIMVPLMVIRYSSKEIWGAFVPVLLFSFLALQVINWGNKEYLLRSFSLEPQKISALYSTNLGTRLPLVLIFSVVGLFLFPIEYGLWLFLWILGRFLIHSVEPIVMYDKTFQQSIYIEGFSFLVFCAAFLLFKNQIDTFSLLILYSLYQLLKGIAYFRLFSDYLLLKKIIPDLTYYQKAFPFLLLSLLGFLASKVDVYIIASLGNKILASDYQIINGLLVFVMSISAFLYAPFTKNIYRTTGETVDKTQQLLTVAGLTIVPIALVFIYAILEWYLLVRLPLLFYAVAFLYVFPSFIYGIEIVNLFRVKKERTVVGLLLISAVTNAGLSALLLHLGYGITGALSGSAIAQWIVLPLIKLKIDFEK